MSRARDDESPFHAGERAVQERLGLRARAEQLGQFMIRDTLDEQHREFFEQLPYVLIGSLDAAGRPWASILTGAPGFMRVPDEQQLAIDARPSPFDPLASALTQGAPLGLLGIQLETRRRNRMNGHVVASSDGGFVLRVDQSFGNCPKYITARAPISHDARSFAAPQAESTLLSGAALACIAACDTCFVASASAAQMDLTDPREGVDVSHRGGKPGFVRVDTRAGAHVLTMPELAGNNMFNTLGNLTPYPRAGLLFLDFERGDLLQLTCTTELVFEGAEVQQFVGAQRLTRFRVEAGWFYPRALPFQWSTPQPSPQHAKIGSWS